MSGRRVPVCGAARVTLGLRRCDHIEVIGRDAAAYAQTECLVRHQRRISENDDGRNYFETITMYVSDKIGVAKRIESALRDCILEDSTLLP